MLYSTLFTASPHSRCQFEATSSRRVVFWIPKDRCQHVCRRKRLPLQTKRWKKLSWTKALARSAVSTLYILSVRTFNLFTLAHTCQLHPLVGKCYKDVVSCCAYGCNNRFRERQGLGFYRFPAVPKARRKVVSRASRIFLYFRWGHR